MHGHRRKSLDSASRPVLRVSVMASRSPGLLRYDLGIRGGAARDIADFGCFFEVSGDVVPPVVDRLDFAVLSLLFFAMHHDVDLHVEGALSRRLLVNLEEFQRAWVSWLPQRYQRIRISCTAEEAASASFVGQRAVLAYSGGVDATCAMLDQLDNHEEHDHYELAAAVLILGFDVGLGEAAGLAATREAARAMTTAVGVPLSIVRTDIRARLSHEWPDEFGAAVAACLSVFAPVAQAGLIASDGDYQFDNAAHGSNMITNPMMSGDGFRIVTVLNALTRTERVARVAAEPAIVDHLRVCWEGKEHGWNCGVCEKCMRTRLNFLAVGAPVPASLSPAPAVRDILGIVAKDSRKIDYLAEILRTGQQVLPRPIRMALWLTVVKNRLLRPWRRWRKLCRAFLRRLSGRPPRSK